MFSPITFIWSASCGAISMLKVFYHCVRLDTVLWCDLNVELSYHIFHVNPVLWCCFGVIEIHSYNFHLNLSLGVTLVIEIHSYNFHLNLSRGMTSMLLRFTNITFTWICYLVWLQCYWDSFIQLSLELVTWCDFSVTEIHSCNFHTNLSLGVTWMLLKLVIQLSLEPATWYDLYITDFPPIERSIDPFLLVLPQYSDFPQKWFASKHVLLRGSILRLPYRLFLRLTCLLLRFPHTMSIWSRSFVVACILLRFPPPPHVSDNIYFPHCECT